MNGATIIIVILVAVVAYLVYIYNSLIRSRNRVDEAWSDIEVQLKRRYDLIPNLVNTVKGYAKHEEGVFTKVTDARSKAMSAPTPQQRLEAENQLTQTLKSLFAVAESYPDLKANQNFLSLQGDLTDTEDKIQASRRFYNTNVRDFNTLIQTFPNNIFAGFMNFTAKPFFDIDEKGPEGQAVNVQF
jgi:LemA protein